MRPELGIAAVTVLLTLTGAALLAGLGLIRSRREALLAAGLAYLVGTAAVMLTGIGLTVAGLAFDLPAFAMTCGVAGAGGLVAARRRGPGSDPTPSSDGPSRRRRFLVAGAGLVAFGYAMLGLVAAAVHPLDDYDAWSIWGRKARLLVDFGSLADGAWDSPAYGFMHPEYPILLPLWEAVHVRGMGEWNSQLIHVPFWLLLLAFLGAMAFLAARASRPGLAAIPLAAAAVAPGVGEQLLTAYADVPMAMFLGAGVLATGLWLAGGPRSLLAVGALLLAAAASTKNEGLMGAAVALAVAGALVLAEPARPRLRAYGAAVGGFVLVLAPWRIWVAANGLEGNLQVSSGLDPSYLAERSGRIQPSARALAAQLADQGRWLWLVPAALAVLGAVLVARRGSGNGRRLAVFYLATAGLYLALVLWSLWAIQVPLVEQLRGSADRLVTGFVLILLAGVVHLQGRLLPPRERGTPSPGPDPG